MPLPAWAYTDIEPPKPTARAPIIPQRINAPSHSSSEHQHLSTMFPPGRGNDNLDADGTYLISLFGTNEVLTVEGKKLQFQKYQERQRNQMWICETDNHDKLKSPALRSQAWGWLTFMRLSLGGYSLLANPTGSDKRRQLQNVGSDSPHFKTGEAGTQFGLHKLKNSVFRRFEWVIPGRLARSSAPYYDGEDSDQSINETSIEFLDDYEIKNIISLNSVELSPREKGRLRAAKISYSHIEAVECGAVTQEQFDQIWNAYDKAGVTIVYCGYGDGRTGMAISAIQLFQGRALDDNDYRENGVQCPGQLAALNELNERLHGVDNHSDPPNTLTIQPPPYIAPEKRTDRMHGDGIVQGGKGERKGVRVVGGRNCAITVQPTLEKQLEEDSSRHRDTVEVVNSDGSKKRKRERETRVG